MDLQSLLISLRVLRLRLPHLNQTVLADQLELDQAVRHVVQELDQLPLTQLLTLDGPAFIHSFSYLQKMRLQLAQEALQLSSPTTWLSVLTCLQTTLTEALHAK